MTALRVRVGERVAMMRLTHGMDREDLARLLRVGDNQIGKIERGETLLTVRQALRIRHAFGVPLDVLYDETARPREEIELLTLLHLLTPGNRRLAVEIVRLLLAHHDTGPPEDPPEENG